MCTITNIEEFIRKHKECLRDLILQDIDVAEEVLAELGYEKTTKKKAPTPVRNQGLCWECGSTSHTYCDRY